LAQVARLLTKIHHIGLAVPNAGDALKIYQDSLGLTPTKDAVLEDQGIRGILLRAGETEIELLEPLRPDTTVGRFLQSRGPGLHHLCFESTDIAADLEDARSRSLPLIDQTPRPGLAGSIAFLHPGATRGVLVEYAQPAAHASTASGDLMQGENGDQTIFDHVTIASRDLDAMTRTFCDNFGLYAKTALQSEHGDFASSNLPIGHSAIEVVSPLDNASALTDYLKKKGEGLYLLSLRLNALDDVARALRGARLSLTEPAEVDRGSARAAYMSPPEVAGVLIQLIERPQ
jgi:methylmalonyl-CoA/ethylmalonyl-CoA epimerase